MKLQGAFNARALFLQHIHFTVPDTEEHAYIVDHLCSLLSHLGSCSCGMQCQRVMPDIF